MKKLFFPYQPTLIILIITAIFIALPQKNGWCMDSLVDPMEGEQKKEEHQKRPDSPSNIREKYPPPVHKEIAAIYREPQWGLHEEETEFLFQNSQDLICIIECGGHFKRLNQTWKNVLGWEIQELLETPYINFVHPEDIEKTFAYEETFPPTGLVNRFRCKDGSYRWLDWIGLPSLKEEHLQHGEGNPLSIARDVTLQKVIEKELEDKLRSLSKESWHIKRQLLETLIEIQTSYILNAYESPESSSKTSNPFLQVAIDHIVRLSKSECGFIGEVNSDPADKIIALYTWGCALNPKETPKNLKDVSNKFAQDIFSTKKTLMVYHMNGYPQEIESSSSAPSQLKTFLGIPLIIRDQVVGIVGLFNFLDANYKENILTLLDPLFLLSGSIINEIKMRQSQKEIELQHLASQKQIEDASTAKSNFLAHMSHEIRTPLTGLLGMLDLINKESLSKEDLTYLQTARGSGLALLSILNDILDISKIEAGQLTIENIKFNPIMIAQEVVQLFTLEAVKKEVEIKLTTSSHIPPYLMGDPLRFRQILSNLVSNALKFTPKGSVSVFLNGICDKGNNKLTLVGDITDTGIGIPLDVQQLLFKPFIQADSSVTRRFGGTGLGLYITKMLCEMMEGNINVSSEVGKGSTFHFKTCFGLLDISPVLSESKSPRQATDKLANSRILVVEDNLTNQLVLKTMLTRAGCSVTTVGNGQEGLEAVTTDRYDLVLMDGQMPVMDGFTATQKIREIFDMRTLPIIGVTAYAMKEDRERFLGVGMNGYLTKPIQKQGLYTEILRCLKKE